MGRLCIRDRQVGDAQIGPAGNIAVFQQLLRHLDGIIDRDGKAQALGLAVGGFGVDDADQLACHIEQAAAGVAGADAGAHLHQGHGVHRTGILDGNAAVQCADDAVGDRTAQLAQGIAHSHHLLAHRQCAGVAHGSRGQALGLDLHHSDITGAVCAHQSGGVILITDGHRDLRSAFHHMGTGQDITITADDHAAACAGLDLALAVPGPLGVHHLLSGNDHHAGADQGCHLGGGQVLAAGGCAGAAQGRRCAGRRPLHRLHHDLAASADLCAHNAAHKAYRCRQQQRHSAAGKVPAALFAGRLLVCGGRCRVRLCRACRAVVPIIVCSVGGIGPTAAHIGIPGIRVFLPGGIIIFPLILVLHNEYVLSEKRGYGLQNGPDDSTLLFYRKIVKNPSPSQ